ncbi:MAG TPA: GIY-YIG nuclease family protein [Patescibacteria group bacterium]|nr:GIY-YIG nuclease family protein [Patescibacteria group bacterium]
MYTIYWLFNDQETYVGFTDNLPRRLEEHRNKQVKTTKIFSQFRYFILEQAESLVEARQREKYWKSATGRKKLRKIYPSILARSSSG